MTSVAIRWTTGTGTGGHIARGILFGLMGLLGLLSAILASPREARGPGRTLAAVAAQPLGPWLLGMLAVGIIVYGMFCLLQARYRRIRK
jgi:uncharacterized protein DUF1206